MRGWGGIESEENVGGGWGGVDLGGVLGRKDYVEQDGRTGDVIGRNLRF